MLTKRHKELIATLKVRADDLKGQLADEDIDEAKYDAIKATKAEIEGLKQQIETERKIGEAMEELGALDEYLSLPASPTKGLVGLTPAGETAVKKDKDTGRFKALAECGPGVFGVQNGYSARAWEAIQDPAYQKAYWEYIRKGERMSGWAFKNLEEGLDPQGGYLAPAEVINRLVERKPTPTRIAGLVENIAAGRDAVTLPKVNYNAATDDPLGTLYTTGMRVTWTDENPSSDTVAQVVDTNLFGSIRVPVYTAMMDLPLTLNMVEDGMFDVPGWVSGKFFQTDELVRDNMILNGSGIGQQTGIVTAGTAASNPGITTDGAPTVLAAASNGVIGADDIRTMAADLPEQYDENARWVMNKTVTYKSIHLIKDSQNRYMFGLGYQDSGLIPGMPRVLDGYNVVWSGFMPPTPGTALAHGQYPVLFGDLKGYAFVNRIGFAIQVLREVAARRNQIILLGRVRYGGQVLEGWRMRLLNI